MARAEASAAANIREAAPAKLNLYLHVTGRRDDGYHLLDSLIVFTAFGDVVDVAPGDGLGLSLDGPFAATLDDAAGGDNLVLRAARQLAAEAGVRADAAIRLDKRLPVAAGLGGGSADAAAALRGLVRMWRVCPGADDLARIALTLGADVPVCLASQTRFVGGVGEALDAAPALPACHVLLVNPGVPLATAAVFAARHGADSPAGRFDAAPADSGALAALLATRRNDLEAAAQRLCPAVGAVLAAIAATSGCLLARMAGSGASGFGLFATADAAERAARCIAATQPDWWVVATRIAGHRGGDKRAGIGDLP